MESEPGPGSPDPAAITNTHVNQEIVSKSKNEPPNTIKSDEDSDSDSNIHIVALTNKLDSLKKPNSQEFPLIENDINNVVATRGVAQTISLDVQKQRLHHIIELIAAQDAKLTRLTALSKQVREQASKNAELNKELKLVNESIGEKDGELRQVMNRVDNLNRQLNSCRRIRANRSRGSPPSSRQQHQDQKKQESSNRAGNNALARRVSFDPLSLLLNAAQNGEIDLVIQTSKQVPDLSASHEECVTALHNATVAGHYDVAKYLIEAGCDINVQDSGGWTPLHCAADCNNLPLAKLLIENGALIYATTSGVENSTPAMLCQESEPNYEDCYNYLVSIQNNLGVVNNGLVYAIYDYEAQREDELSFAVDDELIILRRDDSQEQEWWWAKKKAAEDKKGYIPRNLIGLYRRVKPPVKKNINAQSEPTNDSNPNSVNGTDNFN